jgi:3-hexulose-6-phosphate synthase / 6-phospho-3-hexuloisomerase
MFYVICMNPVLQVALDFINASRALKIAEESVDGGVDWIEAGTPLIKSEGLTILRTLSNQFPKKTIVADLKTMDTGSLETEMASKAGADIICIMAAASDGTIKEAVLAAKKYGTKIMVDLLGIKDPIRRGIDVCSFGVDYLCVHIGIDQQMTGKKPANTVSTLSKQVDIPIAAAGGINSETVVDVINAGASIIIVGGAITKATDVKKATSTIKKAMTDKKRINSNLFKKYDTAEIKTAFEQVSTPNISDAMHRQPSMQGIKPIQESVHMVGRAVTVNTLDGDWAKPVEAIEYAGKNSVIVIDAHQGKTAIWGELATWSGKQKKLAGVVIDGTVRDIDAIKKIDFPVFCRFQSSNAGDPKGFGELNAHILCGGQPVSPGDWIIGDSSGVIVVPQKMALEIANRSLDIKEHENRIREEIKQGKSLSEVMYLKKWEVQKK